MLGFEKGVTIGSLLTVNTFHFHHNSPLLPVSFDVLQPPMFQQLF